MFSLEAMTLGSVAFEPVVVERGEIAGGFDRVAAAGSAELLVFCRGGTLIDDEEVNRPIKIPVSNAVIAIKIGGDEIGTTTVTTAALSTFARRL